MRHAVAVVLLLAASWGCAERNQLGALVQSPRFEQVPDQPAEVRLAGSSGVAIRLWTCVANPNPSAAKPASVRLGADQGQTTI